MLFKKKKPKVAAQVTAASLPAIDPQKLIDASNRLQKMIEDENEKREQRLAQLEETAREIRRTRRNEAAVEDWGSQGCPTTKRIKIMAPLKIKTPLKP